MSAHPALAPAEQSSPARKSLRDTAYEELRARIVNLQLTPGQRLVERELAADLNVSRIPLREAMRQLEIDGLVVIVPRQGTIVAPFTADDVRDLFDVRESLEVLAARLAAQRRDPESLAALRAQLDAATTATAQRDEAAIAAANARFHALIVEMAGNPLLHSMLQPLEARVQWLFRLTRDRDPVQQCHEHEDLLDALAAGDADRAAQVAYHHVASGRAPSLEMAQSWSAQRIDPIAATRTRQRAPRAKQ